MRGLPKRLSRNYLRQMAGNLVKSRLYVWVFKRCFVEEMFSALSAVFLFGWAFACFVLFGCSLFCLTKRGRAESGTTGNKFKPEVRTGFEQGAVACKPNAQTTGPSCLLNTQANFKRLALDSIPQTHISRLI